MTDIEKIEKMGERLVFMRRRAISRIMRVFRLSLDDAQDIYQDTCIYLLDKGWRRLDMYGCIDAAIMHTTKLRAINFFRDQKIKDDKHLEIFKTSQHPTNSTPKSWDYEIDREVLKAEMASHFKTRGQKIAAQHFFDEGLNRNEIARDYGVNLNTIQGGFRSVRLYLRKHHG